MTALFECLLSAIWVSNTVHACLLHMNPLWCSICAAIAVFFALKALQKRGWE